VHSAAVKCSRHVALAGERQQAGRSSKREAAVGGGIGMNARRDGAGRYGMRVHQRKNGPVRRERELYMFCDSAYESPSQSLARDIKEMRQGGPAIAVRLIRLGGV